ncbi:ankyrin repeat domain-containing protein [Gluconobacter oxydans]|uniref:ankyrin repeat domain-containing protein n=1 Tax=Gluconobacter oxydans TaxID=442 RepID=UPI001CD863F8|nr:ankyrin repeat domain-containing protein [Gluconobacter oxydans]
MQKKRVVAVIAALTCLAGYGKLTAFTLENKPMPPGDQTVSPGSSQPMLGAVMNSETDKVRRLAERHPGLDERDTGDQSTPIIAASDTDQWPVVEILIDHGVDIWAHDKFDITTAQRTAHQPYPAWLS